MKGVFVDCVRVGDVVKCPGDSGYSQIILFNKPTRVRKDGAVIELMGRLDELEALASWAYVETNHPVFRDIIVMATAINTYLATGESKWLDIVKSLVDKSCNIEPKSLGWFVPQDRATAMLNLTRTKIREAERVAVKMLKIKKLPRNRVRNIVTALNQASKYVVQYIYTSNVKVYKNIDDKFKDLLGGSNL
jgi:cob(I)alamin adenosyltransferase